MHRHTCAHYTGVYAPTHTHTHYVVFDECMCPHSRARGCCHRSFCRKQGGKEREGKKRGRVLQWQTQSVMQDYSVSFSTAIDVVFMGETQGFSKRSGPCYPRSILETKAESGGGWRGVSPCGLRCLMAAISLPDAGKKGFPGDRLEGDLGSHLGALIRRRWDHYCTYAEEEVTLDGDKRLAALFLFDAGIGAMW